MKMRFLKIVEKNLKLLLRSRSSAFIIIIGPILLIALVGFFFSGKSGYDLSIGYFAPTETTLTKDFIASLEESEFVVLKFTSEDACVQKIKQGVIHTCIIFPPDFQVRNSRSSDLRFVVDYSRINLVYKVIDAVSGIIEFETREVSKGLTGVLLDSINKTMIDLDKYSHDEQVLLNEEKLAQAGVDSALQGLSSMNHDINTVNTDKLDFDAKRANATILLVSAKGAELLDFADQLWEELDSHVDSNVSAGLREDLDNLNKSLTKLNNDSALHMNYLLTSISNVEYSLELVASQLEKNKKLADNAKSKLTESYSELEGLKRNLSVLLSETQSTKRVLESISITRADVIVSPVNTKIEPLVAESSNLQVTFPFLVVLIIMFASLMIASTLVIFEKTSRALFRNFMAPISEKAYILASFVTVLLIVFFQTVVILLISQVALSLDLFSNIFSVFVIMIVSLIFFAVLGLLIGYLFSSQDGAVMASLVVGSGFLFLSNLIVPLESIAPALSSIIRFNPFIIFSEALRKSLLFGASVSESLILLSILLFVSLVILGLILYVKGFFTRHRVKMPGRDLPPQRKG